MLTSSSPCKLNKEGLVPKRLKPALTCLQELLPKVLKLLGLQYLTSPLPLSSGDSFQGFVRVPLGSVYS